MPSDGAPIFASPTGPARIHRIPGRGGSHDDVHGDGPRRHDGGRA